MKTKHPRYRRTFCKTLLSPGNHCLLLCFFCNLGLDYFGAYISNMNERNYIWFYYQDRHIHTLRLSDVTLWLSTTHSYRGHPRTEENKDKFFAFVNVYFHIGKYDKIVFLLGPRQEPMEMDNQIFGFFTSMLQCI